MSVSNTDTYVAYAGDGTTLTFPVAFYFRSTSDLLVTVTDADGVVTELSLGGDYTVTGSLVNGVYANGGSVVLGSGASNPVDSTMLIQRRTPKTQPTTYTTDDAFPAKTHETGLDALTLQHQELARHFKGVTDGIPTAGTHEKDDWYYVRNAADFGFHQVICSVAGTPGTFKAMNPISA